MGLHEQQEPRTYANIISDGSIRVKTQESDPKAVRRDYELRDGTKGTKFERVYESIDGYIKDISFPEGQYGKQMAILMNDGHGGDDIILALSMEVNFSEDLMKKIPSMDFKKPVMLRPFSFTDDRGKARKGVTVYQDGNKVPNFFLSPDGKTLLHGFPAPPAAAEGAKVPIARWKIYFAECKLFLEEFIVANIVPTLGSYLDGEAPANVKKVDLGGVMEAAELDSTSASNLFPEG